MSYGNAVATATFADMTESLSIDSVAEIQLNAAPWPVFDIAGSAIFYPFDIPRMNGPTWEH